MTRLEEKIMLNAENYVLHARMKEICEDVIDGIKDKTSEMYDYYIGKAAYCETQLRHCSDFFRNTYAEVYLGKIIDVDEFMGRLDDVAYSEKGLFEARKFFNLWLAETD